ncbi:MAG: tetratricopeptide repeat protein [Polyangiaceae bacterium]
MGDAPNTWLACRLRGGIAAALVVTATARPALAQAPPDSVAAEALFREGRRLIDQRRFAEACTKLEDSEQLDPAVGTLFSLGECYEAQARKASAWFAYREAETLAARRRDDRRANAQTKAAALEPQLSHLVLRLSDPRDAVHVSVDGQPLSPAALDAPLPVDPGPHRVEVHGERAYEETVRVAGNGVTVEVAVPSLLSAAPASPLAARDWKRPVAIGLVGLGSATAAVGGVLGLQAIVKARDVRAQCGDAPTCSSAQGVHDSSVGATYADASSVLLPLGLAIAAVGVVILLTSHASVEPVVGPGRAGLDARWSW